MESEQAIQTNKKIAEVKKRILLAEGQKKANTEEWEKKRTSNNETINTLKKEIKEMTQKLANLKNPSIRRPPKELIEENCNTIGGKPIYPAGAKNVEEACFLVDLKVIETKKKFDRTQHKYLKRREHFEKLVEHYKELLAYKESAQKFDLNGLPPETLEEDNNRKLVSHLENEIHRTTVQHMEAEHIRKKYRSIQASLMTDAERFEKSLKELEQALADQQNEINRLQQVHKEALEMRDGAKIILQRQEQLTNYSNKAREKQAMDYRRQVEERKLELERIERTLFATGVGKNALQQQESLDSGSADQMTGKTDQQEDENTQLKTKMEEFFKNLMHITGATNPHEVLDRFISQKESAARLNYLRVAAEAEKKHLEIQRENLTNELETTRYVDVKEAEVNQEILESIKTEIENFKIQNENNIKDVKKTETVISSIKNDLMEMIFKLQEVDESDLWLAQKQKEIFAVDVPTFLRHEATNMDLIEILNEKLNRALKLTQQKEETEEELIGDVKANELYVPLASPRASPTLPDEKPTALPICYYNLIRAVQSISASPGPPQQPAVTDDESEVPSRNFLKRQANLIVDAKSRRKGFRRK